MLDKNGVELKAGMVVEITGAYFKNDNGFWFVENAPGDPSWYGSDCCLKKISKAGKISVAKHNICFWPISVFVSDRCKAAEADRWNKANAQIEVKAIKNMAEVVAHFEAKAEGLRETIRREEWDFGEDSEVVKKDRGIMAHYLAVAEAVRKGER